MSPPTTRCRSNAFSMQRPCLTSSSSPRRGPPKLSLLIPPVVPAHGPNATRLTIIERSPPSPRAYTPSPSSASSTSSSSSSPPALSPEDQRNARSKMVAGILLKRHSPKPCPMAGALRAAAHAANGCAARRYVGTPLRLEVC